MKKKVNVIIPVYNAAKSLERCVESIIYGEMQDISILLVEDCSSDNSWDICLTLAKRFENVYCFQNEKNSGVSFTRNHGLTLANSEYILFVDSDDWVSGKYAQILVETAQKYKDALVICGLHFHDEVVGYRRDYLWKTNEKCVNIVRQKEFFELPDCFLLQQLWNKIFCRDIIEKYHIRFDESQNMGEDYQFVLDYMEAAEIKQCVVINEPLYYYIRANKNSLMSRFGLVENSNEYERLKKLIQLSGMENETGRQLYEKAVEKVKYNYIYQVCRDFSKSKKEKLDFIEKIMNDGKAESYYDKQLYIVLKENLYKWVNEFRMIPLRVKGKYQRIRREKIIAYAKSKLTAQEFTIISQNCIGGIFYHDMGMRFLSPTIDLYFTANDFVRFVQRLGYYINLTPEMYWGEEYPIGILDDIHIYFMHYDSCREASEAWERRKKRICWDKIIVFCTDMESFTDEVYGEWEKITYPKVLFTAKPRGEKGTVYFPKYAKKDKVPDLIPNREFYSNNIVIETINDAGKSVFSKEVYTK